MRRCGKYKDTHKKFHYTLASFGEELLHAKEWTWRAFHARHLEQKIAEISLCCQPDLIVMDGRKAFAAGGPNKGEVVEPGFIIASGDLVAVDVEGMKVLLPYGDRNHLPTDPWQSPQIVTALKHRLGAKKGDYRVVS